MAMSQSFSLDESQARRSRIVEAALWCFLNFGFAKTSMEDIAKRAGLSRSLLYRSFKDKDEIYSAAFEDWLVARRPLADEAAQRSGLLAERLLAVCRIMVIEPWSEMSRTAMGSEFLEVCSRIAPESEGRYRAALFECVNAILQDEASTTVFLLSLSGLTADGPATDVLERRAELLAARFTGFKGKAA